MRLSFSFLIIAGCLAGADGQSTRLLRTPTVSATQIAFAYANNVWTVERAGGTAADYIIDVLQRDFDGYFNNVAGERYPFTSPSAGIWGPKVMVINEMAGSGGDLMPYMFKYRKIGLLVGKRTWGGLVHTADTPPFIDGGSMIAPRGGFFNREGKWAVENEGVTPDVDVENWPKDVIAGHDPQLERAVQEALRMLKEKPVNRLSREPPPPTWGQRKQGR
jgi:tricorn protease